MSGKIKKIKNLLITMANDPNNLKRGVHRSGMIIGSALSILIPSISLGAFFAGLIISPLVFPFIFTPIVVLAKGIGWIIEGFQK